MAGSFLPQRRQRLLGLRTEAPLHVRHVPGAIVPLRGQAGSSPNGHQRSSPPSDPRRVRADSGSRHLPSPERQIHDRLPVFGSGLGSPRLKGNSGMRRAGTIEICLSADGRASEPDFAAGAERNLGLDPGRRVAHARADEQKRIADTNIAGKAQ